MSVVVDWCVLLGKVGVFIHAFLLHDELTYSLSFTSQRKTEVFPDFHVLVQDGQQ